MNDASPIVVLLADDDDDDRLLIVEALQECGIANEIREVVDGEDLLDYLHARGKYDGAGGPVPGLILLDLNMPKLDGREALRDIKSSPDLRRIPVVALTTSKTPEDVAAVYELGANAYIAKPVSFPGYVSAMRALARFWLETVELPPMVLGA